MFGGGGFHRNVVDIHPNHLSQTSTHPLDVGIEFGTLSTDCGIDIPDCITTIGKQVDRPPQENLAVNTRIVGTGVGK